MLKFRMMLASTSVVSWSANPAPMQMLGSDAEWQIVVAIDLLSSPIEWIAALSQDPGSPRAAH
jgi:hypothetical protein